MRAYEDYLGDGVVAYFDGYQIVLETERLEGKHFIALETPVFNKLVEYQKRLAVELSTQQTTNTQKENN